MNQKNKKPFRSADRILKLNFTEEEQADPNIEKLLKKEEKAGDKLEKAQEKLPWSPGTGATEQGRDD